MKSAPSRGADAPHIHQRLRKRLAKCTLDCGFKTSESPALRGFVAERCPITGTSLYLVLKSNGLRHSKNPPVKFSFSLKIVPATIAKKLPPQRCFKPLLIPIFNFSHKRPTFAFTSESGYTLGFAQRIAHSGLHAETGAFPSAGTAWLCAANRIALNAAFATPDSTVLLYTYISRFSVNPHYQQTRKIRQSCRHKFYPQLFLVAFSTSRTNGPRSLLQAKAGYTLGFAQRIAHKGLHAETRVFQMGVVSLPSERFTRFGNPAWPEGRTANFAAFGPWSGVLSKNTESLRNSDALMRIAVPKASRPRWAAQLYLFIGVFTFVKDLAGCCQYSSPITKGAADSNIRIGTLSGHDQNTPRRSKIQKLNAMRQHIRVLQCMALRLSG